MDPLAQLLGTSPEIVAVREQVRGLLKRQAEARRLPPILIQGETGTGKGLVARAMHSASVRASGPFVDVNCAAIPETLLEAEMFGVERGAFTDARQSRPGLFQLAHRGTIFLDEIGLLPEALQAKLLKVIEEREVRRLGGTRSEPIDVWVVAATNEDLTAAVSTRRFRADLYHRLAVVTLSLPALRDRRGDVLLLAEHFLARACADYGLPAKTLGADARGALVRYAWPGNVRELSNVMERVALLDASREVGAAALALPESRPAPAPSPPTAPVTLEAAVDDVERATLLDALTATNWNVSQAAARLGISRNTLRYRIEKHRLRPGAAAPSRRGRRPVPAREAAPPEPAAVVPGVPARAHRRVTLLRVVLLIPAGAEGSALGRRTLALLSDKVRVFGGRVEDVNAAGMVAVFGVEPVEDAPARAAHAAIAALNAVERARRDEARQVQVKVAIHVDQFLVNLGPGPAIELEARPHAWAFLDSLLETARPDEVVVSEATAPFLRRNFDLTPTPEGHAFHLGAGERAGLGLRRRLATFVGRQHELELLRSRFAAAASGRGQVVGIAGDAGIGKSRLLLELRHHLAGQQVEYLQGQCLSYASGIPYLPVLDMLRITCRIARTDAPDVAAEKVRTVLYRLGMDPSERAPYLLHLLGLKDGDDRVGGLSPEAFKARIFGALRELTLRQSQQCPLVLVLEDLHWIDESSEELFTSMVEAIPSARIVLVATYRPGYRPTWIDKSYATQMALQPLPPAESLSVVRALLGSYDVGPAVVDAILGKAEGNPFFLEELTRSVREQRVTAPPLAVPDTVQEVLQARINRLPPSARQLLQTAAVLGKDVPVSLLERVAGIAPDDLSAGMAELRAGEFLYETSLGAESEYTFRHILTHEVAYESLDPDLRRFLHARIVDVMEDLYPQRLVEQSQRLAHHAYQGGLWAKAADYLRQAGRQAAVACAHREAAACLDQALAALAHVPETPQTREAAVDITLQLRNSLLPLGEFAAIFDKLERVRPLAVALGDRRRLAWINVYLTDYFRQMGEYRRALESGRLAMTQADEVGEPPLLVAARTYMAHVDHALGEYRAASELLASNVALLHGDLAPQHMGFPYLPSVHSRTWLALCLAELGDFARAIAVAEEAVTIAESADDAISLVLGCWGLGRAYLQKGDLIRAVPILERGLELSEARGIPYFSPATASDLGLSYALSGRVEDAIVLIKKAVSQHASMRRTAGQSNRLAALGRVYLLGGFSEDARDVGQQALALAREHHERGHEAHALQLLGDIESRQDRPERREAAAASYQAALALARELEMRPLTASCRLGLGLLLERAGARAEAREHMSAARTMAGEMDMQLLQPT
ncbi:MAG TPA: sigma 54-interacting transcriptional regulator [Methylomirabilota bacterium]|nr:sigma 54-interacting transcriptional regulator [Methylomirabilota bacterium]